MPPYLSNFEQVQHEVKRLTGYSLDEIRRMDDEFIINLCCAFIATAYEKISEYSLKYFDRGRNRYLQLSVNPRFMGACGGDAIILNPFLMLYSKDYFMEVLLHELTHTIYSDHGVEFLHYLQHILFMEGIITEKPLHVKEINGKFKLYYESSSFSYREHYGFSFVRERRIKYSEKEVLLLKKLFVSNQFSPFRRTGDFSYLVSGKKLIPISPIWDKYIMRYELLGILHLEFDYAAFEARKCFLRNNITDINTYETFKPIQ